MKLRLISRILVISLVVVVGGIMLLRGFLAKSEGQTPIQGTDLGRTAAPGFTLSDQNGMRVSLASLHGHPIVLSFMDTHCPSSCPMATKERAAMQALGDKANAVSWVVVSTDPTSDTAETAREFVWRFRLAGLHFLLGDTAQLAPVWQAYAVAVEPAAARGQSDVQLGGLYLIDAEGRERVYLDSSFAPGMLEGDLRALLM